MVNTHEPMWWWKRALVFAAFAIPMLLVGLLLPFGDSNTPVAAAAAVVPTAKSPAEDLTVNPGDILPADARCTNDEFITNSLPSESLLWGDSVSTPFTSTTPVGMFAEVRQENCGNPTVLQMNIDALMGIDLGDGSTLGDVNPWMGEFVSAMKPEFTVPGVNGFDFLLKKEGIDGIFVTPDFQQVAELTNTVLLRLEVEGVKVSDSLTNWHVDARSGLAAGTLPVASLNSEQEVGKEFLVLDYTSKTGCPLFTIGFNVGDKRFATLPTQCGTTPTTTPPATTPPSTTPTTPPPYTPKPPTAQECLLNPATAGCPTIPGSGQAADELTPAQQQAVDSTGGSTHQPSAQDNPGPGLGSTPPASASPNGLSPAGGSAPAGSSDNGVTTELGQPKVTPQPQPEPTLADATHTGDQGQPG